MDRHNYVRDIYSDTATGRLIGVLAPASQILSQSDVDQDVVRQLRILVDAITPDI